MEVPDEIQTLLDRIPQADADGKFTGPDPGNAAALFEEILAAGRDRILQLVDRLAEPGTGDDWKARYILHGLALHTGRPGSEAARRLVAGTLASRLGGDAPKAVKAFLCQTLQFAGQAAEVPGLGALLADDELSDPAARAILSIGEGAAEAFRAALPRAKGPSRLQILQALGVLCDAASAAAFIEALGDTDREVRLLAGWGLARTADAGSIDRLLKAADGAEGWERVQGTKHCLLLAERLAGAGKTGEARRIYEHLSRTRTDASERYIQVLALAALK